MQFTQCSLGYKSINYFMRYLIVIFIAVTLVACSQDSTETSGDEVKIAETVFVKKPSTYPEEALPDGLKWQTNNAAPLYASPKATKGGTYRTFILSFPLTLRVVGPDSNSSFRAMISGNQLSLTDLHPETEEVLPSLATHWAYDDDGRTVYYKLNPSARWSDGRPVTADDYVFARDFMRSENIVAPWYNKQYTEEIVEIKKFDNYTISVTGSKVKPKSDLHYYYGISPKPRHFHQLDKDWVTNYNWKIEPNTGPYKITKIKKGRYVEFSRKKDWWAKELRYNNNRYNVDKIKVSVIRDIETAYRHFLKSKLDTFAITLPAYWHEKTIGSGYGDGYIRKIWFYNDMPQPASGMYLNQDITPLDDINVRLGLHYSMNFYKMINTVLRGDYLRLNSMDTGYGEYSNIDIRARKFDLDKADFHFNKAGWDRRGPDGIRTR